MKASDEHSHARVRLERVHDALPVAHVRSAVKAHGLGAEFARQRAQNASMVRHDNNLAAFVVGEKLTDVLDDKGDLR